MNKVQQRVVQLCGSYVGQVEVPMGSNRGTFVVACQKHTWLAPGAWPWCVAFGQRVHDEAGIPCPWKGAGAYAALDWARKQGWARSRPVVGCWGIVNEGSGHLCVVVAFNSQTGIVSSIDGNWGDKVTRVDRHLNQFRGFVVDPKLTMQDLPRPAPVKPKLFNVVTSASGHSKLVLSHKKLPVIQKSLPQLLRGKDAITIRRVK